MLVEWGSSAACEGMFDKADDDSELGVELELPREVDDVGGGEASREIRVGENCCQRVFYPNILR